MIKLFKQHIVPFVIATRKCVTVVVNIVHFGHSVNGKQIVGMGFVFVAILMEVVFNMWEKKDGDGRGDKDGEGRRNNINPA